MRISAATVTSPSSASDRDRPPLTPRPSKREQPATTNTTTTMLGTPNPTIRPRGTSDTVPTTATSTKNSSTWLGYTRGLTQVCVPARRPCTPHRDRVTNTNCICWRHRTSTGPRNHCSPVSSRSPAGYSPNPNGLKTSRTRSHAAPSNSSTSCLHPRRPSARASSASSLTGFSGATIPLGAGRRGCSSPEGRPLGAAARAAPRRSGPQARRAARGGAQPSSSPRRRALARVRRDLACKGATLIALEQDVSACLR